MMFACLVACRQSDVGSSESDDRASSGLASKNPAGEPDLTSERSPDLTLLPAVTSGDDARTFLQKVSMQKVREINGDKEQLSMFLEKVVKKYADHPSIRDEYVAMAIRSNSNVMSVEDVLDIISKHVKGVTGKILTFSYVEGIYSKDLPKLQSFAENMPISPSRQNAFQRYFVEKGKDTMSYEQSIVYSSSLVELGDIKGAQMGLEQARDSLISEGLMTKDVANAIIQKHAVSNKWLGQLLINEAGQ